MKVKKRPPQKSAARSSEPMGSLINQAGPTMANLEAACLKNLRKICLALPEAKETVKWGHPTFDAGKKTFAVLDNYHGHACIVFRTSRREQARLLRHNRFFAAPYAAAHGWVCLRADSELDWPEVENLIVASYRLAALKRMLSALDGKRLTKPAMSS
jgi:predicted DNA-binding protein (MmcQ/YjbR family)